MSITNGYCTLNDLKAELTALPPSGARDEKLELAIEAGARDIDGHCGRPHGFWQDATLVTRYYTPDDPYCVFVPDDISTTAGLIVKLDTALNGTYATTLTLNTHFRLAPANAAADSRPWDEIILLRNGGYSFVTGADIPYVSVTSKFGWATTHTPVKKANLIQAVQLFMAPDSPFGSAAVGLDGAVMSIRSRLHPLAVPLLEPYVRLA